MEFTRNEVIQIYNVFGSLMNEKVSVQTALLFVKNKKLAEVEFNYIEEVKQKFAPEVSQIQNFNNKRLELCKELGRKDNDGNPILVNGNFTFTSDNKALFDIKYNELIKEYGDISDLNTKIESEFAEILNEKLDIAFIKIPNDSLPKEMTSAQLEIIFPLLEE